MLISALHTTQEKFRPLFQNPMMAVDFFNTER
jgi:hypothetical protein